MSVRVGINLGVEHLLVAAGRRARVNQIRTSAPPRSGRRGPVLYPHHPAVLTGVKGLRCAPVLVDGLRPPLTPAPPRRGC